MFSWVMVSPSVESMVFYCWRLVADYLNVFRPTLLYLLYKNIAIGTTDPRVEFILPK